MKKKKMIKNVMKHFDFEAVHKVMETLNWTWHACGDKVPNVDQLKVEAKRLLKDVIENSEKYKVIATGGFEASYYEDVLVLKFIVSEWEVDKNEDEE